MERLVYDDINRYRFSLLNPNHKFWLRKYLLSSMVKWISYLGCLVFPLLPKKLTTLERPIFIIGCSRSGTTLFLDMFLQHLDLANWSEAGQIFELDYYNPNVDHIKDKTAATQAEKRRLCFFFGIYTHIVRKPRFLNKHPQNSLRIPYLKAIFPDAIFIHLIRDPRAVVWSHLAQVRRDRYRQSIPFGSFPKPERWREYQKLHPVEQYTHQWIDIITAIREAAREFLGCDNYIEVKYETFCADSHRTLAKLDEFCRLDRNTRNYAIIPQSFEIRNTQWQGALTDKDLKIIENLASSLMDELGYIPLGGRGESHNKTEFSCGC